MELPKNYYTMMIKEFSSVKDRCNEAKTPEDLLYFFSASYGIVNRIMNLHSEPLLIFIHQSLQSVHQALQARLTAPKQPGVVSKSIPEQFWTVLLSYFTELITAIEKNDDDAIRLQLQKYANLAYASTGNGFYLYLQGKLDL